MNHFSKPQLTMQVDDCDDAVDLLDALVLGPFLSGVQPWSRAVRLHRVRPDASLLPPGRERLARRHRWWARITSRAGRLVDTPRRPLA